MERCGAIVDEPRCRRRTLFEERKTEIDALRKAAVERAQEKREAEADQAQTEKAEANPSRCSEKDERRELARLELSGALPAAVVDYRESAGIDRRRSATPKRWPALERVTEGTWCVGPLGLASADRPICICGLVAGRRARCRDQILEESIPDNAHAQSACAGGSAAKEIQALPRISALGCAAEDRSLSVSPFPAGAKR